MPAVIPSIPRELVEDLARGFRQGADVTTVPELRRMLDAQIERIQRDFEKLPVRVEFVGRDPYGSYEEMRDQVRSTGVLRIWTGASDVPMWDRRTNWMARAVHDWDHLSHQFDFSMEGEYEGYRVTAAKAPQLAPIAFSERARGRGHAASARGGDPPGTHRGRAQLKNGRPRPLETEEAGAGTPSVTRALRAAGDGACGSPAPSARSRSA